MSGSPVGAPVGAVLRDLAAVRGVRNAAVVTADGRVVEAVGGSGGVERLAELVTAALASSEALAGVLGGGGASQTLVEYEDAPVLLAPLPTSDGSDVLEAAFGAPAVARETAFLSVVTLDGVGDLGRVRFQLRRLLPELARALSTGAAGGGG